MDESSWIFLDFLQIRSQEKYVESSHYTSTDLSGGGDILVDDISRDQSPRPMSEMSSCWDDSEINSQEVKRREHNHKLQVFTFFISLLWRRIIQSSDDAKFISVSGSRLIAINCSKVGTNS